MDQLETTSGPDQEPVKTLADRPNDPPYILVLWRTVKDHWSVECYDRRDFSIARSRYMGLTDDADTVEVRIMDGSMIAKWGPLDPGGLFNTETRKKRSSHV